MPKMRLLVILFLLTTLGYSQQRNWHNPYGPRYTGPHPRFSYGPGFHHGGHGYGRGHGRISPGAAAAIGLGAGVVGFIIGRSASNNSNRSNTSQTNSSDDRIECRNFPMKVIVDNKPTEVLVQKCRVGGGEWKLPD